MIKLIQQRKCNLMICILVDNWNKIYKINLNLLNFLLPIDPKSSLCLYAPGDFGGMSFASIPLPFPPINPPYPDYHIFSDLI